MSKEKALPTSRTVRTAMLGRVVAGQAARHVGMKIATAGRSDEVKTAKLEKRQAEAAKAIVNGLGTMRGAAMKIGQMLAMVDLGVFPEEIRADMQKAMAKLLDSAPTASFATMCKVIEGDLGRRLSSVFADFDETPLAAASIGQVYRARLHDGREVAVKVQYPGVDKAIRADLRNLSLVMKAGKAIAPNADWNGIITELTERLEEELDYEVEAQNHRRVARLYRGHPFIVIPDVLTDLCGPRVLVTEFFDGTRYEQLRAASDEERNRVAEIVFRFYFGSMFQHRQFSPDPHPGNFLVGADGRVAFLDFGLYKHLDPLTFDRQRSLMRAILSDDVDQIHTALAECGIIADPTAVEPRAAYEFMRSLFWWAGREGATEVNPDVVNAAIINVVNPMSEHFDMARHQSMPPDQVVVLRMFLMVMATLGQLRSVGDWHSILREWLHDDTPATAIGAIDAEFRNRPRVPVR